MAFLQTKLFCPAKSQPASLKQNHFWFYKFKNQKGFMTLFLLPLITLMATGIMGLAALSVGIKNITQTQSICIKNNIKGQKELGILMGKILHLNKKALKLHQTRQTLKAKLALAIGTGQTHLISPLKKTLSLVQNGQKALMWKQKSILNQSQLVKEKTFQKLKRTFQKLPVSKVQEKSFFKKALALEKQKIGDKAYNYKPVSNFTEQQKVRFSWKMNPFYPLDKNWLHFKHKKAFQYQCTSSLIKKGNLWISHLYH